MGLTPDDGAKLFAFLHHSAAVAAKQPLLVITVEEGKVLYVAINDLAVHYGISLAPVYSVWSKLAAAVTGVYGPRVMLARQQAAEKKKAAAQTPFERAASEQSQQANAT